MDNYEKILILKESLISRVSVYIDYRNKEYESNEFLIKLVDLDFDDENLNTMILVKGYNEHHHVSEPFSIRLDRIMNMVLLEGKTKLTYEEQQKKDLLAKITTIEEHYKAIYAKNEEKRVLDLIDYYIDAQKSDRRVLINSPTTLVGVDLEVFSKIETSYIHLDEKQYAEIMKIVTKEENKNKWLYINEISLKINDKVFPVAFYQVFFDPENRTLSLGDELIFNEAMRKEEDLVATPLRYRSKYSLHEFKLAYLSSREEAIAMLDLSESTIIDTSPTFITFTDRSLLLSSSLYQLRSSYVSNEIAKPLTYVFNLKKEEPYIEPHLFVGKNTNESQLKALNMIRTNDLSFIFGPPGTGKSHTIIDMVLSTLFTGKTILISANANHPLDEIANKLDEYQELEKDLIIPYFRIGRIEKMSEDIDRIRATVIPLYKEIVKTRHVFPHDLVEEFEKNVDRFQEGDIDDIVRFDIDNPYHRQSLKNLSNIALKNLFQNEELLRIFVYQDDDANSVITAVRNLRDYILDPRKFKLFLKCFPIIISTSHATSLMPRRQTPFDLVFLDEAAACPIVPGLYSLMKGHRAVLCGDEKQLNAFSILDSKIDDIIRKKWKIPAEFAYSNHSILDIIKLNYPKYPSTFLKEHYRCQEDIIRFCNEVFYGGRMIIRTKKDSEDKHLFIIDTIGGNEEGNRNHLEIDIIINDIIEKDYDLDQVAIITPFVEQRNSIISSFKKTFHTGDISVGTVHSFQGDQKDIVYFSLACNNQVSTRTLESFVSNRNLVNVAISRAKHRFVAVGAFGIFERRAISNENPWVKLIDYAKKQGTFSRREKSDFANKGQYKKDTKKTKLTRSESDFKRLLKQIISILDPSIKLRTQVSLMEFVPEELQEEYMNYHYDFVASDEENNLHIAFELDGPEHISNLDKTENDLKKNYVSVLNPCITLKRISNADRCRYTEIKELFRSALGELRKKKQNGLD